MMENETRKRELEESKPYREEADRTGEPVTYVSQIDGCKVTVWPGGSEWFNVEDWY